MVASLNRLLVNESSGKIKTGLFCAYIEYTSMLRELGVNQMSVLRFNYAKLAFIALSIGFSFSAQALLITDSQDFNFKSKTLVDLVANDGLEKRTRKRKLTLDGFDSSLGLLTGVEISFITDWGLKSKVLATDPVNNNGKDTTQGTSIARNIMTIDLINPDSPSKIKNIKKEVASCKKIKKKDPRCKDVSQEEGYFDGMYSLYGLDILDFIDNDIIIKLTQRLTVEAKTRDADSVVTAYNQRNFWYGAFTVDYDYEAFSVPEPSTLLLLFMGFIGMSFTRFRKAGSNV